MAKRGGYRRPRGGRTKLSRSPHELPARRQGANVVRLATLRLALEVAVPLKIEEVRRWPWDVRKQAAEDAALVIAEKGDGIQFNDGKGGKPREAFNALVTGLAIGALQPGGARIFGLHFEARP